MLHKKSGIAWSNPCRPHTSRKPNGSQGSSNRRIPSMRPAVASQRWTVVKGKNRSSRLGRQEWQLSPGGVLPLGTDVAVVHLIGALASFRDACRCEPTQTHQSRADSLELVCGQGAEPCSPPSASSSASPQAERFDSENCLQDTPSGARSTRSPRANLHGGQLFCDVGRTCRIGGGRGSSGRYFRGSRGIVKGCDFRRSIRLRRSLRVTPRSLTNRET